MLYIYILDWYSAIKTSKIFPFSTTWMDLESIMLSEISHTKINIVWYYLYVESKKYNKLGDIAKIRELTDKYGKLAVTSEEKKGGLQSMGSQRVKHNWSDWAHTSIK